MQTNFIFILINVICLLSGQCPPRDKVKYGIISSLILAIFTVSGIQRTVTLALEVSESCVAFYFHLTMLTDQWVHGMTIGE